MEARFRVLIAPDGRVRPSPRCGRFSPRLGQKVDKHAWRGSPVVLVGDIMETDIVTAPADTSLRTVVERMLRQDIGSVIVTRDDLPAGIITETDVLVGGYRSGAPFAEISAEAVMTTPLITITEGATTRKAVERMQDNGIKKLPVVDELDLIGILTMTDLVHHQNDLVKEAHRIEDRQTSWLSGPDVD